MNEDTEYELVKEQTIKQSYQFAQIKPMIEAPAGTNLFIERMTSGQFKITDEKNEDKAYDTIMKNTDIIEGRPNLSELLRMKAEHYNFVWLYTKIDDRPELVDGLEL